MQNVADGLGVAAGVIPGDVGDRAQHRIEHDGARHVGGAEGAADGAVVIGEKRRRCAAAFQIWRRIVRWRRQHPVEGDVIFVKQLRGAKQLGQFLLDARIGRLAEEGQHDPAAGGDREREGAFADQRRAEPRDRIAKDDAGCAVSAVFHDGVLPCGPRDAASFAVMVNFILISADPIRFKRRKMERGSP